METNVQRNADLRILLVSCVYSPATMPEPDPVFGLLYTIGENGEDAEAKIRSAQFDCVLAFVDPGDRKSIACLETLQSLAGDAGTPLASMSLFNPQWIENLMGHLGIAAHFREFPDLSLLQGFIAEHEHALMEPAKGQAQ